jgi:AcrR family transcriptional regulator
MRALPGHAARTGSTGRVSAARRLSAAEEQRRRIRRATGELIAKRGYADVTVELIVKRARVSFKTFYKHYANKGEAFVDLYDRALSATIVRIDEVLKDVDATWPEQVAIVVRTCFEAIREEPLIARACLVEGPTAGPEILGRFEEVAKAIVPLLRRGRDFNPEARNLPDTLEDTLAGAVLWSAYQRLILSEVDRIEALIPETIELVLRPYIGEADAAKVAASLGEAPGD